MCRKAFIYFEIKYYLVVFTSNFCYYKGLYKVKVLTKSGGYWIIEALETLQDYVDYKKVTVKAGEKSIVLPSDLYKKKTLQPQIPKQEFRL